LENLMEKSQSVWIRFFGVPFRVRTYLNLLYLLLAFPLGLIYFCFFVIGVSLGLATVILLIGFLILAFVGLGWWAFAVFERYQAIWLLGMDVPPMDKPGARPEGFWNRVVDLLSNPVTWKSLIFLIIKFPLGVFTFIVLVTLAGVSLGLVAAPLVYWWLPYGVDLSGSNVWLIDTLWEALIAFIVGVIFGFFSLHVLNYLAYVSGLFAQIMLGNRRTELAQAPATAAVLAAPPLPAVESTAESIPPSAPVTASPVDVTAVELPADAGTAVESTVVTAQLHPEPVESTVVTAQLHPEAVEPAADIPNSTAGSEDEGSAPDRSENQDTLIE
jgi:hypothetical protein